MAITNVNNLQGTTYTLDDFDETKNYQRILFKPGFAVQARELTQLQTALQAQIDKLGQHTFADGDRVLGGKLSVNVDYAYVKLESVSSVSDFVGTTIEGGVTGVTAEVLAAVSADSTTNVISPDATNTAGEPIVDTLYVKYTNSGDDKQTQVFASGETITSDAGTPKTATVGGNTVPNVTGIGSTASIAEGVYFISGNFVYVESSTIILDHYRNTPNYIVALNISESIISSSDDTTLQDNANNTTNAAAPGADRYKVSTVLIKQNLASSTLNSGDPGYAAPVDEYVHLITINDGIIFKKNETPIDTELSDRLERRTSEESGDYILAPFILDIKEYLNNGTNGGYKTVAEIIAEEATVANATQAETFGSGKLAIGIDPSTAYIDGRRIEKLATEQLIVDKPRTDPDDVFDLGDSQVTVQYGNYIKLSSSGIVGVPEVDTLGSINLKNSAGATIGTCRARDMRFNGSEFELYIFDVTMTGNFSDVHNIAGTGSDTFTANLAVVGQRFSTGKNSLLFNLPAQSIKTVESGSNKLDIIMRQKVSGTISGTTDKTLTFSLTEGTLADLNNIIVSDADGTTIRVNVNTSTSSIGSGGGSATIKAQNNQLDALSNTGVRVIVNVQGTNLSARTKQTQNVRNLTSSVFTFNTDGNGLIAGGRTINLGVADVYNLVSIKDADDAQGNDVTASFVLDTGQRDSYYDIAKLTLKGGETLLINHTYHVEFDYYSHGTEGDYFSVDSYGSAVESYENIPSYNGINLRDALDFRPVRDTSTGFARVGTTGIPGAFAVGTLPIKHWMPRIDKVFLTKEGNYQVVQGRTSRFPVEPENIENAIHLYNLSMNAYVFNTRGVGVNTIDNKLYTMKDIGNLDRRVKHLEYYTSLSLLETSAAEAQILDSTGAQRFKNGFIVDGFFGHNKADSSHPDYGVSIDKANGILRPQFDERNINLIKKPADTGTTTIHNGGVVTLPYTEVTEIDQPQSSYAEFVNPYNVIIWDGTMKLSPESDEWKETDQRPDIIIDDNSQYEQMLAMADENGVLGTVWNEWETNWTGRELVTVNEYEVVRSQAQGVQLTGVANTRGKKLAHINVVEQAAINTGTTSRDGVQTYLTGAVDTVSKVVGNFVVETNFIPFMRSRKIFFKAELLKPNTKVYAFFNGINVTAYCKDEPFTEFHNRSAVTTYKGKTSHPSAGSGVLETDASGTITGSFVIPNNSSLSFKTGTREFKITDSNINNDVLSSTKVSQNFHAQGLLETYQRTIINTKVPRIASREVGESRTVQTVESGITKHELIKYYDPIAETFVIKTKNGVFTTGIELFFAQKDAAIPIIISIREVQNGYPTQRIIPGAEAIVYPADISLPSNPSANSGVGNADVATSIDWDFPVHLKEGAEYAIVCISNSDKYKVYVAETSQYDLTTPTKKITKQPFDGVFFTSANASTWTAEQSKDLKFKLKRASFNTSSKTLKLQNDAVPPKQLELNPLFFLNSGTDPARVKVFHKNHGMYGPDGTHQVTIAGVAASLNGIAANQFNATHTVKEAELDSYVIELSGDTATASGIRLGGVDVTATENQMYDVLRMNISSVEFPGVDISYDLTGRTAKSQDGHSGLLDQQISPLGTVLANKNIEMNVPHLIASTANEDNNNTKTLDLVCTFSNGGQENLTPIIDLNRTSLFTIQNRINDAASLQSSYTARGTYVAETSGTGTSNVSKYITKQVELATEGTVLDIFLNANKPKNANIDVYFKTTSDSDVDFNSLSWTLLNPEETIPTDDNNRYAEVHYQNASLEPFSKFQIKIVLRSRSSTDIPTVRDFRAIATT